jgi:hypothetical protein
MFSGRHCNISVVKYMDAVTVKKIMRPHRKRLKLFDGAKRKKQNTIETLASKMDKTYNGCVMNWSIRVRHPAPCIYPSDKSNVCQPCHDRTCHQNQNIIINVAMTS